MQCSTDACTLKEGQMICLPLPEVGYTTIDVQYQSNSKHYDLVRLGLQWIAEVSSPRQSPRDNDKQYRSDCHLAYHLGAFPFHLQKARFCRRV